MNPSTANANGEAIYAGYSDITGIILSGPNENIAANSTGANVLHTYDATIAADSALSVSGTSGVVIYSQGIQVNGTLNLEAGTIVKGTMSDDGNVIDITQGGTLNVNGLAANPVVFTSYQDDTAGGDTNGDGTSSGGTSDYASAIHTQGGTLDIRHAVVRSGNNAIVANCMYITSPGQVTITDSQLNSRVEMDACGQGVVSLQRNQLSATPNSNGEAIYAGYSDISGIILSGANKNVAVNNTSGNVFHTYDTTIATGSTMSISGDSGIVIYSQGIQVKGILNLEDGAILKGTMSDDNNQIDVSQGGALNINGNSTNPVILTSFKDDSVGGDSNNDGSSTPAAGDYGTAINAATGSTVALSDAKILYASAALSLPYIETSLDHITISNSNYGLLITGGKTDLSAASISNVGTGITVNGDAQVTYRGSFSGITGKAISSCDWSQGCFVDAAYTDWGSASGPYLTSGSLVCGQITVAPWVNQSSSSTIFSVKNCDNVPTPSDQLTSAVQSYNQRTSSAQIQCGEDVQDACDQINRMFACINAAIGLATYNSPFPLPSSSPTDAAGTYIGDYENGASTYVSGLEESSPAAFSLTVANQVAGVAGIFSALANAYNSCN